MAKRLWIAVLIAAAVACKSSNGDGDGSSNNSGGGSSGGSYPGSGVENALRQLGIPGGVRTLDLNQANFQSGKLRVRALHMTRDFVLAEGSNPGVGAR